MPVPTVEQGFPKTGQATRRRAGGHPRLPSTVGYMVAAAVLSLALFLLIWFMLRADGDEAPWIPAGLAAGFVILVAAAVREVVMRRAWARYTRDLELEMRRGEGPRTVVKPVGARVNAQGSISAMRALQQRIIEMDTAGAQPETHREAYRLCEQYLSNVEEVMRTAGAAVDIRAALRAGQERVRGLQRKHLLSWARGECTRLTQEAQRRVRPSDRIETAQQALEVLGEAARVYPGEPELQASAIAVRNFIASVKVGQWVEMAERSAFRGKYARAIARYRDALFYLSRADMGEDARAEAATRIQREIEMLRARQATTDEVLNMGSAGPSAPKPVVSIETPEEEF